jgi:predicted ester cyclase
MSETEKVVREFHHRLWGELDTTVIDELIDPDAVTGMTGFDGSTRAVVHTDVARYRAAFTDVTTEIQHLLVSGADAALWWRTTGTHTGPYGDIAPVPTGRRIVMSGVVRYRVADGRIREMVSLWDAAAVYRQFDLLKEGL